MSRSDVLVDADWVEAHLDDPTVVLVEVDEDISAYDTNHIRGAVRIDWRDDLQDPVRRDFVNQQQFEALLSRKGIGNDDTVVLYGGNNNWFASYAYWYFKLYGHRDVKLLDGGRKKWELDGRELVDDGRRAARHDVHRPAAGHLDPRLPRRRRRGHRLEEPRRRPLARRVRRPAARPGPPAAGAVAAGRPHPDRAERAVEQGGQRRRHLQVRRGAAARSTAARASTSARTPSPTAGSASARRTPGSCCTSCSASRTCTTTTARGPSTAPSSACPSSSVTRRARPREGRPDVRGDHRRARRGGD